MIQDAKSDIKDDEIFQEIFEKIKLERNNYKSGVRGVNKFLDILSAIFFFLGFILLIASFFSFHDITIIHATCIFVISRVIEPSDGDRYEEMIKGISEDIGNIRLQLEFRNKKQALKEVS